MAVQSSEEELCLYKSNDLHDLLTVHDAAEQLCFFIQLDVLISALPETVSGRCMTFWKYRPYKELFTGWQSKVAQCAVQGRALHTRPAAMATRPSQEAKSKSPDMHAHHFLHFPSCSLVHVGRLRLGFL
jgi:hypothetical protein